MSLRQGVSRNPADQMEAHGYGRKTFRFETDVEGEPVVHRVDGQHPDTHYNNTSRTVLDEIGQVFDVGKNIYFIVNSTGLFGGGVGGGRGRSDGFAMVADGFSWKVVAYELGHAFRLWHDFRDGAYIMSYGPGGIVGIPDFLLFVDQFGFSRSDGGYESRFDLDGNGVIGVGDFLIFVDNFWTRVGLLCFAFTTPVVGLSRP